MCTLSTEIICEHSGHKFLTVYRAYCEPMTETFSVSLICLSGLQSPPLKSVETLTKLSTSKSLTDHSPQLAKSPGTRKPYWMSANSGTKKRGRHGRS
jgi:hypothetical protein